MAKITRVEKAGSFETLFIFEKANGETQELRVPADQGDAYQTAIENATWAQINTIYNRNSTTVIKEN